MPWDLVLKLFFAEKVLVDSVLVLKLFFAEKILMGPVNSAQDPHKNAKPQLWADTDAIQTKIYNILNEMIKKIREMFMKGLCC